MSYQTKTNLLKQVETLKANLAATSKLTGFPKTSLRKRKLAPEENSEIIALERYPNGQIKLVCEFVNGIKHGICDEFNQEGKLQYRTNWVNGKLQGPAISYWLTGEIEAVTHYENGKEEGLTRHYYKSGKPRAKYNYKSGQIIGPVESWYETGELEKVEIKDSNNTIFEEFYKNGKLATRGKKKGKLLDGPLETFHENGKLAFYAEHKDGKRYGLQEQYDEKGNLIERYTDRNGTLDGEEIRTKNGQVIAKRFWNNGIQEGPQEEFYSSRIPKLVEFYKNGKLEAERVEWHPNGNIAYLGNYSAGKPHGMFQDFDEKGKLLETRYYLDGERVAGRDYHISRLISEGSGLKEEGVGQLVSKFAGY